MYDIFPQNLVDGSWPRKDPHAVTIGADPNKGTVPGIFSQFL